MAVGTTSITRTPASTGNRKTYTLSYWVKRSNDLVLIQQLWNVYSSSNDYMYMRFIATGALYLESKTGGAANIGFTTTRLFRDPAAWYHIVLAVDTAQAVTADRWTLYVNGVDVADTGGYSASDYSSQDVLTPANTISFPLYIGADQNTDQGFAGCMSHVQMVDGLALAPTEFGEFDSTSGIWKIKTGSYATPGTNGFHLKMEDRTNLDLDSSSNAFTFTTAGTLTASYDNPSNNFSIINILDGNIGVAGGLLNGGTTYNKTTTGSGYNSSALGTQGVAKSKWYWEVKIADTSVIIAGFGNANHGAYDTHHGLWGITGTGTWGWRNNGDFYNSTSATSSTFSTFTTNDILSFAIDLDNGKAYAALNGVWENSGDPTSGATGTGSFVDLTDLTIFYTPLIGNNNYAEASLAYYNFGNGYFASTAVASANADDAGIGAMEYDVPTGYYCLCTKNIKAYG